MFILNYSNFDNERSFNQFQNFSGEGGLLPSFSINFFEFCDRFFEQMTVQKKVGDYTFYDSESDKFYFSYKDCLLELNNNMDIANVYLPKAIKFGGKHEVSYLTMQAYMFRLVTVGDFMIHSAAVVYNDQGILFCGKSGAGKSTQANLWNTHLNSWALNYDKPCIIRDNGKIFVHGSPWSGKEALYLNKYVPLKAIVFVKQSKENTVKRLSTIQAYSNIYLHNYVYPLTREIENKYDEIISDIALAVPTYELSCDISENAVEVLYKELFSDIPYLKAKEEKRLKYKVKDYFQMKQIADEYVVIPRGNQALDFNATVIFNESGAFLWNKLSDYTDKKTLSESLAEKYNIDIELAEKDTDSFLNKLKDNKMLDCE